MFSRARKEMTPTHDHSRPLLQFEISYHLSDWQVLAAYPMTTLTDEDGKTRVKWFAQVDAKGVVTDLMTGTEASGLFLDIL